MTGPTFEPFADEHVDGAARLLAHRNERHRESEPLLPDDDAREWVEWCRSFGDTSGAVALRDGEVVAFVLADVGDHPLFGRNAWIERPGHATSDPEVLRDLYAFAAEAWVGAGADRHYVLVPALAQDLEPWYRLGFHHMHVEAIRESGHPSISSPEGVAIRQGTTEDLEHAAQIDLLIYDHQRTPPSFSRIEIDREAKHLGWLEMDLSEPGTVYLVAERDGTPVGHALLYRSQSEFGVPKDALYLASVAVDPAARGLGIGGALTAEALERARLAGHATVVTNWRMTNLEASRFWPARGFRPVYHRLHRIVGIA